MELKEYLRDKRLLVESQLEILLPANKEIPVIGEAMRYSLFAGGKRLRPILAILACELFRGSVQELMPFACSIEMIHTYSLIHDDLPAMDDDDFRRGKPTSHKVFGEGFAVLAGDALLNHAFETIIKQIRMNPKKEFIEAAGIIAEASGTCGMIGGQCIDLYYENREIDYDTLVDMHEKKTGAMISASLMVGAVIAGANSQEVENIERYGRLIGLAFQIADDILDEEGSSAKLGKKTGSDKNMKKSTFISQHGVEKSKEIAGSLIEEAKALISVHGEKSRYLCDLAEYIISREE